VAGPGISRRGFLLGAGATLALAACSGDEDSAGAPASTLPLPDLPDDPFTLGVASGDPLPERVILWTRLAPRPRRGGGMPPGDVSVRWEMATDEAFADVVREGVARASSELAHSVHVDADGLEPDSWYHYRFRIGDHVSPVGRTRTTPTDDASPERLRLGVASCQDYQEGYYTAYPHLVEEDLDLILFLGDYIYEDEGDPAAVRSYRGGEPETLADYRNRYGIYKGDAALQAAHAACPWVVTWDDHEVDNNYAGLLPQDDVRRARFRARRDAAYQAWYEHQPVRLDWQGPGTPIYRSLTYGDLARIYTLDTRQYRSDQPCGGTSDIGAPCPDVDDPQATLLGAEQEAWLFDELGASSVTWDVLAQQIVFAFTRFSAGDVELFNLDQWDGYRVNRRRVIDAFAEHDIANPILLCGDVHTSVVADIQADPEDYDSPVVASEFGGVSITSTFPEDVADLAVAALRDSPDIKYFDPTRRGYLVCELTPERCTADFSLLETTQRPVSAVAETSSWVVEAGRPGPRPA
jgi:alkaline phosphatase D